MSKRKRDSNTFSKTKVIIAKDDYHWTDGELLNLIIALQRYGLSETKKIAEVVKTKSEIAVKNFLTSEVRKVKAKLEKLENKLKAPIERGRRSWHKPKKEELQSWPTIRKWRKTTFNQLLPCVRKHDYSKILLEDLFQTFYNEAEEPTSPEVVNIKAVYKFILDCIRGIVPAELSPLDSGVVLLLLGQLKEMQNELDFDEEKKFIMTFRRARPFAPIKVKDEFRAKTMQRSKELQNVVNIPDSEDTNGLSSEASCSKDEPSVPLKKEVDKDAIMVVEEMYANLSKHRKLVQSFNPLNIPLWDLVKEQGYIQNKCELDSKRIHVKKEI